MQLHRRLREEGKVSLGFYYQLFDVPTSYTDDYYGWTELPAESTYAQQWADGCYHVVMPRPPYEIR